MCYFRRAAVKRMHCSSVDCKHTPHTTTTHLESWVQGRNGEDKIQLRNPFLSLVFYLAIALAKPLCTSHWTPLRGNHIMEHMYLCGFPNWWFTGGLNVLVHQCLSWYSLYRACGIYLHAFLLPLFSVALTTPILPYTMQDYTLSMCCPGWFFK